MVKSKKGIEHEVLNYGHPDDGKIRVAYIPPTQDEDEVFNVSRGEFKAADEYALVIYIGEENDIILSLRGIGLIFRQADYMKNWMN
ncbi:hypothetical protein COU57_06720 [Candidatus Pacearchaeota archaeon CG10_big_fil_rev_8_21_14_0_10_32_14]|nr:MAG: hypothetical protein COU57_06720 [Candidatus Pacearchaeota archaeon CG10_big_fil_rev_8_21_14_0_10_32_14]